MLRFNIGEPVVNFQLQNFVQENGDNENQPVPTPENVINTLVWLTYSDKEKEIILNNELEDYFN